MSFTNTNPNAIFKGEGTPDSILFKYMCSISTDYSHTLYRNVVILMLCNMNYCNHMHRHPSVGLLGGNA